MFDLTKKPSLFKAKFGVAVTFLVFSTACAHQLIHPANNDSAATEITTPEPLAAEASELSPAPIQKVATARHHKLHGKVAHRSHKARHTLVAKNAKLRQHKMEKTIAAAAVVAPAPGPVIALPAPPPQLASLGVAAEADPSVNEIWSRLASYWAYALIALAVGGLLFVAPRVRRSKPKRKLVYNG